MSLSYDIDTSYDALDDTIHDIFDVDAYCSSLSPSVPSTTESVPHAPTPAPRLKRYPKTRGHPRPSPAIVSPPVVSTASAVASTSSDPATAPAKPDKGKGRQRAAVAAPPSSPVDASTSTKSVTPIELTPEQHVCLVRMLKRLNEWLAQGWQPGVDESRLRSLAEIFDSAEAIAEGSISNIRRADLAWRLADSEGWEKSAGSSIMGAIDIQVAVTKILYKDYGESLIASFRSFLGQKEAELGDSGCPTGVSGPSLQKEMGRGDLRPNVQKRVRFEGLDSPSRGASNIRPEWNEGSRLLVGPAAPIIPSYDETCATLSRHLAFVSGTAHFEWLDFLLTLHESAAGANALRSRYATSPIPDVPFAPVATGNQLQYLLAGRGQVADTHPLGAYRCFRCDPLGHWSADHDRSRRSVYGGPCFVLTIVFFYEYAHRCYVLNGRVTCSPDSLTLYSRSPCHVPPVRVLVRFLSGLRVSSYLLLVLFWLVDSSPVTCSFPISPFVLSARTLTFLAYVFLLLLRRLVSRLVISGL